jgi:hypothetical protein
MNKLIYALPCFFLIALSSCSEGEKETDVKQKDTVVVAPADTLTKVDKTPLEEEEVESKLALSTEDKRKITPVFDVSLLSLKELIPDLHSIKSGSDNDKLTNPSFTISKAKIKIMNNIPVDAEFHFKNDSLYKYSYTINQSDYTHVDQLYKGLQNLYSTSYGHCDEGKVEEENHYSKSCIWSKDGHKGEMHYDVNSSIISWGFEK